MSETIEQSSTEEALGSEFWTQPGLNEVFNLIYSQALAALRDEVRIRQGNALDYMLVERLAFSYAILRQREAGINISDDGEEKTAPLTDRTRREMNKDWLEFSLSLKKLWFSEDKGDQSEALIKKVDKAVFSTLQDLPPEKAKEIQQLFANVFTKAGI